MTLGSRTGTGGPPQQRRVGTRAQRLAINLATLTVRTEFDETDGVHGTLYFMPGDVSWRTSEGKNPDAVVDTGAY